MSLYLGLSVENLTNVNFNTECMFIGKTGQFLSKLLKLNLSNAGFNMSNVRYVVRSNLCTGCGTCVGICPQSALVIRKNENTGVYQPEWNQKKCVHCGMCLYVCPGYSSNIEKLNDALFGKKTTDSLLGHYEACYVGYSNEQRIRYNATSGGLVTALLTFALDEGIIDGALVTRMNPERPLEPEPFIAKSRNELISSSKSKYCPVHISSALRQISEEKGKFAVVGLPCHIQGIRKAERMNKCLQEKIRLHFGLFCSHTPSFLATNYLLWTLGIKKEDISKIDYRGRGWPGGMSILLRNGRRIFIPHQHPATWGRVFGEYFYPFRCTLCSDATAELSDLSFGDPWNLSIPGSKSSLVIVRSRIAADLIRDALSQRKIELTSLKPEEVIYSQKGNLLFKKDLIVERLFLAKLFGANITLCSTSYPERGIQIRKLLNAMLFYCKINLTSKKSIFSPMLYPLLPYLYLKPR